MADQEFKMVGRLVMTPRLPAEGQPEDVTKYMVGGVFFSQDCPFSDTKEWDMLECEIVVKVKKAHKPTRLHQGDLVDMISIIGRDSYWTSSKKAKKKVKSPQNAGYNISKKW